MSDKKKCSVRRVKSRELRSGWLYTDCDCYRHNGLQYECPRKRCGGMAGERCRVKPVAQCDLAMHFRNKWQKDSTALDSKITVCDPRKTFLDAERTIVLHDCLSNKKHAKKDIDVPKCGKPRPLRGRFVLPPKIKRPIF